MSAFAGFTDADIRKVQNGGAPVSTKTENESQNKAISNISKQKRGIMIIGESRKEKDLSDMIKRSGNEHNVIPEEAKLSAPTKVPAEYQNRRVSEEIDPITSNSNKNTKKSVHFQDETKRKISEEIYNEQNSTNIIHSNINEQNNSSAINNDRKEQNNLSRTTETKKPIDFDEFQSRQKLMEEQNRRRKELLAKALADRTKRSQQEQQRLNEIQNDFKKLDASLSNDVKILRKQIETASLDYMEAQKRYHKIEREFLDAKLYLHQKLEKKEMLTEHLCAIIEKNEERKADKLNELLQKLEVNDGGGVQDDQVSTSDN